MRYTAFGFAAAVLWTALSLGSIGGPAQAQSSALQPLAQVLQSDGTLDLGAAQNLALDPTGYKMAIDDQGRPRFTPARMVQPSSPQVIEKWSAEYGFSGADNIVTALAVYEDKVYVGGYFSALGPIFANRIAKWDGSSWSPLGTGVDGNVHAIAVNSTGVYIGGDFIYAGDTFCQRLARWDGARWEPLGEGFNGKVRALAITGGFLYAGGEFTASGSTTINRIARWDGASWSAVGAGVNAPVLALAVNGSDLYVGGEFTFIGGTPVNRVARWTGTAWFTLAAGCNNTVRALAYSNGFLYAGGDFTLAGTTEVNYVARWNGASWADVGGGADSRVTAIVANSSSVYIGGHFLNVAGTPANRLAKWTGTSWQALGAGVNSFVYALALGEGDRLYIGGDFTFAGTVCTNHLAEWRSETFSALYSGKGFNGNVYAILMDGGNIYVGGSFSQGGGISANNIIKYDGTTWSPLANGVAGTVYALTRQGSDIYAGGRFNNASGTAASNIAKWNGAAWSALGSGITNGSAGTGTVFALASNGIDSLVAGGEFRTAGSVSAYRVACWKDGTWRAMGLGMDNTVYTLAYESFMFFAGGKFKYTQGGGFFLNYAALYDDEDSVWRSMGTGTDSTVYVMKPGGGGVLYVGGNFTQAGGAPSQRLARWEGSLWVPYSSGANGRIRAIDVTGGNLYIGGDFSQAGGIAANRFAILNMGLSAWSAPGNGLDSTVYALSGGDLYIGGAFTAAGSKPSFHFAQWLENNYVYLEAKVLLQGPYDPDTDHMTALLERESYIPLISPYADHRTVDTIPDDVTDWVLVELRNAGNMVVARKSVFLRWDGRLVDDNGTTTQVTLEGVPDGSYYLVIRHRNHIAVMSSTMLALSQGASVVYDFTTGPGQYLPGYTGDPGPVQLETGVWGLWAGDVNQDGMITTRDYVIWYSANFNAESGYCISDIDLNGSAAATDFALWKTNAQIDPRSAVP